MSASRAWDREYGSYAEFYAEVYGQHVTGVHPVGSFGAVVLEAVQSAGDWSDAATPDLAIGWLPSASVEFSVDLGAGRFGGKQRTNDAILIAPGAGASIQMGGPHVCRLLSVPYARLQSASESLPLDGDFGRLHSNLLRHAGLHRLLHAMWHEASDGSPHGTLYADGLILQLAGLLLHLRNGGNTESNRGGLAPWQVKRATERLLDDLTRSPSLAELAAEVNLNPHHFCRAFKQSTGLPPHRWQLARRIERAQELLVSTDLPVTEVAAMIGYEAPSQLTTAFRKAVGVTPTQYRRERKR